MLKITGTKRGLLAFWQTLLAACLVQYTGLFHLRLVALVHSDCDAQRALHRKGFRPLLCCEALAHCTADRK